MLVWAGGRLGVLPMELVREMLEAQAGLVFLGHSKASGCVRGEKWWYMEGLFQPSVH